MRVGPGNSGSISVHRPSSMIDLPISLIPPASTIPLRTRQRLRAARN